MTDLVVIVPSRGRPQNAARLAQAFVDTCTAATRLVFVVDDDDPTRNDYVLPYSRPGYPDQAFGLAAAGPWQPMVPKLNAAAMVTVEAAGAPFALGFMGDDHMPRTHGWDTTMLDALREMDTGVVYGDDLLRRDGLPTSWVMTSDIVRALGRMVPAPVEHMYCDNAIRALAEGAGCLRYLPDVIIEHVHPVAGKTGWDDGYRRVNSAEQYRRDGAAYVGWATRRAAADIAAVRALLGSRAAVTR